MPEHIFIGRKIYSQGSIPGLHFNYGWYRQESHNHNNTLWWNVSVPSTVPLFWTQKMRHVPLLERVHTSA